LLYHQKSNTVTSQITKFLAS